MSKIIDLTIFYGEPLVFKGLDNKTYEIPFTIPTGFTIKLMKYYEDISKLKSDEKAIDILKKMVVDILNLDKSKNVDLEYIANNFDDIRILKLIIEETVKHIQNISNEKNLNSPELE